MDTPAGTITTITSTEPATLGAAEAPWMQLPLRALLTDEPGLPVAVTLVSSGVDAVLLRRVDAATVEVLRDGDLVREADSVLAAPVVDLARRVELLRAALGADVTVRQTLAETAEQRRVDLGQLRTAQDRTLDAARDYAIAQYRDDEFSRDVLDGLLQRLGVDPYRPRVKVTYTITGSFEVDGDDTDEVETNVEEFLRPSLDDVDNVVDYSDEFDVTVRSVEPVDD